MRTQWQPNKSLHLTAAQLCGFRTAGMIGRWIGCQRLLPAAVGELCR